MLKRFVVIACVVLVGCSMDSGPQVGGSLAHGDRCGVLLPNQRNTTYTANAPVKSGDLNDIQDCIVGAKHPELEIGVAAASFVLSTAAATASFSPAGWAVAGSQNAQLWAPIYPPVGSRITHIKAAWNRNGGGSVTLSLYRFPLDGSGGVQVATVLDSASVGEFVEDLTGIDHAVLAGNAYVLSINATAPAAGCTAPIAASWFVDRL